MSVATPPRYSASNCIAIRRNPVGWSQRAAGRGLTIICGGSTTGKSTLARHIISQQKFKFTDIHEPPPPSQCLRIDNLRGHKDVLRLKTFILAAVADGAAVFVCLPCMTDAAPLLPSTDAIYIACERASADIPIIRRHAPPALARQLSPFVWVTGRVLCNNIRRSPFDFIALMGDRESGAGSSIHVVRAPMEVATLATALPSMGKAGGAPAPSTMSTATATATAGE